MKTILQKSIQKRIGKFAILMLLIFNVSDISATHMAGADLTYRWISGLTYEFTATLYRDCSGISAQQTFTLNYQSASGGYNLNATLNRIPNTGQEITFPCAASPSTCTGGIYPGIQQYVYTAVVTLPARAADWQFSFQGCCRNCAITTLTNPCSYNMYISASLNNLTAATNSSPIFTNIPVAFICRNQDFNYNHGVIDVDGDSLAYSFISPKISATGTVNFASGFSATNPLSSNPPISLNEINGDIFMHATNAEVGVTTVLIKEYRNGNLIGSITRDMQFWTTVCFPNVLPTASGINGTSEFSITATPGQPLCFDIFSNDDNVGQEVTMTWNNTIAGATFVSTGSPHPVGTFCWTPQVSDGRSQPYTFTVSVRDDNCPQNSFQVYSYSIIVPAAPPAYCSFTQGYYGNAGGLTCNGISTTQLLTSLLNTDLEIGWGNNKLILTNTDVNCLLSRMPGNGTTNIISGNNTCKTCPGIPLKSNKFRSTLLTQTITLGLNLRMDNALANYYMGNSVLWTSASDNCNLQIASPIAGSAVSHTIPANVLSYLDQNRNVSDLYTLANKALGGNYIPSAGMPTLGEITNALGAINNAFDKCRIITGPNPVLPAKSISIPTDNVLIFPNPANKNGEIKLGLPALGNVKIQFLNSTGMLMHETSLVTKEKIVTLNIPGDFVEGLYILRVKIDDKTYNNRLVISK